LVHLKNNQNKQSKKATNGSKQAPKQPKTSKNKQIPKTQNREYSFAHDKFSFLYYTSEADQCDNLNFLKAKFKMIRHSQLQPQPQTTFKFDLCSIAESPGVDRVAKKRGEREMM
jgi:hypothetical protein